MTDETEQQDTAPEPEETTEAPAVVEEKSKPVIKKWNPGPQANRPGGGYMATHGGR